MVSLPHYTPSPPVLKLVAHLKLRVCLPWRAVYNKDLENNYATLPPEVADTSTGRKAVRMLTYVMAGAFMYQVSPLHSRTFVLPLLARSALHPCPSHFFPPVPLFSPHWSIIAACSRPASARSTNHHVAPSSQPHTSSRLTLGSMPPGVPGRHWAVRHEAPAPLGELVTRGPAQEEAGGHGDREEAQGA